MRFFAEALVHTKGRWARKPFVLTDWQRTEHIEPVFCPVEWSEEWETYRRVCSDAYFEEGRKNGKTEEAAGIALLLTCADDEESAEVYGFALDVPQARKVFDVAMRMVILGPLGAGRRPPLEIKESARRIVHDRTGSYYEVVPSDAAGNVGHNPHGVLLDEAFTQRDGDCWEAMKTAEGTRVQPLFWRLTTAGNNTSSWGYTEHEEAERIAQDPARAPHRHVVIRAIPTDADVFDEANWPLANPALGEFKSWEAVRKQAIEARNDPTKENAFRQFQGNQWVNQVTRWMQMGTWDTRGNVQLVDADQLAGETCFAGLDLASTTDLAAWALLFPAPTGVKVLWRFWTPEAQLAHLDKCTGGKATLWEREGLLTTTEGDWIDYETIHRQIELDKGRYRIILAGYDPKEATATAQHMQRLGLEVEPVYQGYALSDALKELMRLCKAGGFVHGGHPVARWHADCVEVRRNDEDLIKIVKPDRGKAKTRIDGIAAAATAIKVWREWVDDQKIPNVY